MGSEELVRGAIDDLETSALAEKDKALLRFVTKVNHRAWEITAEEMQPLYAAGWTDEAIYNAITVCALFNFYNRWIDADGRARHVGRGASGIRKANRQAWL